MYSKIHFLEKKVKVQVYKKIVKPSLLYDNGFWTVADKNKRKSAAPERRFRRKIEGIAKRD